MGRNVHKSHGSNRTDFYTLAGWLEQRAEWSNATRTLRGAPNRMGGAFTGMLEGAELEAFKSDLPDYVIYSYATPIAWHGRNGWVVPDTRYSQTTSCHQGAVKTAVGAIGMGNHVCDCNGVC